MRPLWLYLHFPHLQLDTLLSQSLQQYPDQAIVILDAPNNSVLQLNLQALDAGVRLNMGLATAAALKWDLQVIPYQLEIEQKKLAEVAEWLYLATSDISFYPPNGLLLRVHNMLNLYGGLQAYWRALETQLATLKLTYHYATGHSPFAARMLARAGKNHISADDQQLKLQVGRCTLAQTELDEKTVHKLNRVGVHLVQDLLDIPLRDIAKRFNIALVTYLGRLTGEFQHPVEFFHPVKKFSRYLELLYDIDNTQILQHPLKQLLMTLQQFLKIRDQITNQIIITFHQRDQAPLSIDVHSGQGEYLYEKWLTLVALQLENLQLAAPVFAIGLSTGSTRIRNPDKLDLFAGTKGTLSSLQLVALLQAKLGQEALTSLTVGDDFRPEVACIYGKPLLEQAASTTLQGLRPSFLLQTPQALTEKVSLLHGPERIYSGWWDNQHIVRDYFIARSCQGCWYWVFKTPEKKWYLHGVFS
ncbi:MAG: protein ImuB [Paraglaciecola sp.]|jgi:protein ImuB